MHAGAFEARTNSQFAAGLDHASGSAQVLGVELRITHTFVVGLEIMETATSRIGASDLASDGGE